MPPILTHMHKLIPMVTHICYSQIYGQILNFLKYNSIIVLKGTINIMKMLSLPFSMILPHFPLLALSRILWTMLIDSIDRQYYISTISKC